MATVDTASTTVTERQDMNNPTAPGGYQARVFDFQRAPGSTTANIDVALVFNDPSQTGNYSDLWVVGPGDFDAAANTPVTFDTSDPFALSRTYTQWIPPGVASLRWVDSSNCGGNPVSCPYPEMLMRKSDSGWGELAKRFTKVGFSAIGPIDTTATPWMYSPFYRKDTERYTATLADPITTTPAVGTNESYTFSDADTAPLMAGLEVTIDSEVMRLIAVSGQRVTVYRGSNGTKPATHAAGQVSVSGRRATHTPASGIQPKSYAYQITTATPHGQFTGSVSFATMGTGWPSIVWTDGTTTSGVPMLRNVVVTGPNTFTALIGGPSADGAKPSKVYPLDPTQCFSQVNYGSYIPPEVCAIVTGKFPKASLHVNINSDATDDFVWHYMRLIRDNFPAGRNVIVEYMNEPWNFGFTGFEYCMNAASKLGYENPYSLSYYMRRSGEIGNIARAAFKEKGRDGEIKLMLNCQLGSDQPKNHLTYAAQNGWQVDRIGNAPYLSIDTGQQAFSPGAPGWDDDQLCDLWPMFLWYDSRTNSYNGWTNTGQKYVADYNKAMGNDGCQLMGYEGGIEYAVPAGSADRVTRGMDLVYNPNWYWMEDTFYRWCQRQGFVNLHVYSLSQYHSPHLWGMYHGPRQKPGYGDGRFGGQDNRLRLARPGQPHSKGPLENIDWNDSVRGQAFINRINGVDPPPITATVYSVTAPDPASGLVNTASGNFTVQPSGPYTGTITATPSGGGLSAPIVSTWAGTSAAQTFAITPTSAGTVTISLTNSGGLPDQASLTYLATAPPPPAKATAYTVTAPETSSGVLGSLGGPYTVQPNGPYTGTVTVSLTGGGFGAATLLSWAGTSTPQTISLLPTIAGTVTIGFTNSGGLPDQPNLTYTVTPSTDARIVVVGQSTVAATVSTSAAKPAVRPK
jgi:hypothetical protein